MSIASFVLTLAASVPAQNALAVDATGERVALRSGPNSVAVYEHRAGTWQPLAAGRLDFDFTFIGAHFVQDNTVRAFDGKRIAGEGTPIDGVKPGPSATPLLTAGDTAFFWLQPFALGGPILQSTDEGLKRVGTIEPTEGVGELLARSTGMAAFSGERVAVFDRSLETGGCRVSVIARGDGDWNSIEQFQPQECMPGGDDFAPKPAHSNVIGIAIEGDRIALGTEPAEGLSRGEVLLFRRSKGAWTPAGRIARPVQADEPAAEEGFAPHGFGRRIVLSGKRAYVSDTWSQPTPTGHVSVDNGVLVMLERDGEWQLEQHYVHATRTASFGQGFVVRGERLFIDSPGETAAYVFERRGGEWKQTARIPKEEADDAKQE